MTIRKYTSADRERIIEILRLNTPAYFSPNEESDLIYYLDNDADNYYIVEFDDEIIGCGGFNLTDDRRTAKISWDIIDPQDQRKGVGKELTKFRINKIKEIESVETISVRTSQLVYKFYERFGLELRETVADYWDKGFDLYRLDQDIKLLV